MENNNNTNNLIHFNNNLKKSVLLTTGSCILGAIIFFVTYFYIANDWLLILSIALFLSGIGYIFVVKYIKKRYSKLFINDALSE